jgi:post-segregation antitoxin (ccd killing protein)
MEGRTMRRPPFEAGAPKCPVTLSINSDLRTRAERAGLDLSGVAERAFATELVKSERTSLAAEIAAENAALDAYVREHGSFAEHVRQTFTRTDDAV